MLNIYKTRFKRHQNRWENAIQRGVLGEKGGHFFAPSAHVGFQVNLDIVPELLMILYTNVNRHSLYWGCFHGNAFHYNLFLNNLLWFRPIVVPVIIWRDEHSRLSIDELLKSAEHRWYRYLFYLLRNVIKQIKWMKASMVLRSKISNTTELSKWLHGQWRT